jgi:hypothetical protein
LGSASVSVSTRVLAAMEIVKEERLVVQQRRSST